MPFVLTLPSPTLKSLKMAPTTRTQSLARRKTLRSYPGWQMFKYIVVKPPRTHKRPRHALLINQPKSSDTSNPSPNMPYQALRDTQSKDSEISCPPSNLINEVLPSEILRIIMLMLPDRTLLLECQPVCKRWAGIISLLPLDLTKIASTILCWSLHVDAQRLKGRECTSRRHEWARHPRFTYEKASWRRYLRNHFSI